MNLKKKLIKGVLGIAIAFFGFQIGGVFDVTIAHALGGTGNIKTIPNYGNRDPATQPPVSFKFTQNAPQMVWYHQNGNPYNIFYEENYKNRFLWYSFVPRQNATAWDAYMARMYENQQKSIGTNQNEIDHYATKDPSFSSRYNLKKGKKDPFDPNRSRYAGDESGTQVVTYGPFKGHWYEWRYLGYSADGEPIANPYFPDDYPPTNDTDQYWKTRNWIVKSWTKGFANFNGTVYDSPTEEVREKKAQWLNKYMKPKYPGMFDATRDEYYWADRLSLRNNPEQSTGIVQGWHKSVNTGRTFYKSFVLESPKRPNLRLTKFTVKDKETGQVIGHAIRNETNPYVSDLVIETHNENITKGRTYIIEGRITNMKENGMTPHNTIYTPVTLDLLVGYDEKVHEYNGYTMAYTGASGCQPTSPTTSILYGTSQDFQCEFTVPNNGFNEIELGLRIPIGFFEEGDNTNNEDDIAQLIFKPAPNDMALSKMIQILDRNGNPTETVVPGQNYGVRFTVSKPTGSMNVKNATVNVTATDKGSVSVARNAVATEVLTKGGRVEVTLMNVIRPNTNVLEICGVLDYGHVTRGENILNGNDGKYCKTIQSDINISVQDFKITPQVLYLPYNMSTSYETLHFQFTVNNYNEENISKNIPFVIKKGNTTIATGTINNVPANSPYTHSLTLYNVPMTTGTHGFTVEVNPSPRMYLEAVAGVSNPYLDNIAKNSITVHRSSNNEKCDLDNPRNTWTTTYEIYQWWGHLECDEDGCWCEIDDTDEWEITLSHYEEYRIEHVYFKSKYTVDNEGGWIDLIGGSRTGKVKAGYGFEMKIVAHFSTNINTAPQPWTSGCSGRSVDPRAGYTVYAPTTLTVTMPYKDKYGNNVQYSLNADTSGPWYNEVQEYQFPLRNVFGEKNTREIFINENAKDGTYQIRIDTDGRFRGSYDKPYTRILCDREYVYIEIIGSNKDDLKSHITQ